MICCMCLQRLLLHGGSGRHWVALSLREAECLRGALHIAMEHNSPIIAGHHVAVGLRVQGTLLDSIGTNCTDSQGGQLASFPAPPRQQLRSAMQAFRFIDSQFSFTEEESLLLLRMLRADFTDDRRRWFVETCACRRRPQGRLEHLPRGTGLHTVSIALPVATACAGPRHCLGCPRPSAYGKRPRPYRVFGAKGVLHGGRVSPFAPDGDGSPHRLPVEEAVVWGTRRIVRACHNSNTTPWHLVDVVHATLRTRRFGI